MGSRHERAVVGSRGQALTRPRSHMSACARPGGEPRDDKGVGPVGPRSIVREEAREGPLLGGEGLSESV